MKGFRKAVTIFIDVLGSQDRENFEEWYHIMEIFEQSVKKEKQLDESHKWTIYKREIHVFSDCAYIIYDYKDVIEESRKDMNALMCIACYNTEKLIYEFLRNGFIVRGAITYGDIYYEDKRNIWFGPAMNRAYYLETKVAKYPRIIIDPDYVQGLINYNELHYRSTERQCEMNGEIIRKDIDDIYYLNYFNSILYMIDAEFTANKIYLLCQTEKRKRRENEKWKLSIKEKYDWLQEHLLEYFEIQ